MVTIRIPHDHEDFILVAPYGEFNNVIRPEIIDWLTETLGKSSSDMTNFIWTRKKRAWYIRRNIRYVKDRRDPRYDFDLMFRSEADAMLFKLTWGGVKYNLSA